VSRLTAVPEIGGAKVEQVELRCRTACRNVTMDLLMRAQELVQLRVVLGATCEAALDCPTE